MAAWYRTGIESNCGYDFFFVQIFPFTIFKFDNLSEPFQRRIERLGCFLIFISDILNPIHDNFTFLVTEWLHGPAAT